MNKQRTSSYLISKDITEDIIEDSGNMSFEEKFVAKNMVKNDIRCWMENISYVNTSDSYIASFINSNLAESRIILANIRIEPFTVKSEVNILKDIICLNDMQFKEIPTGSMRKESNYRVFLYIGSASGNRLYNILMSNELRNESNKED